MSGARVVPEGLDEIRIQGIRLECVIGFEKHELDLLQPVDLDVVLAIAPPLTDEDGPGAVVDYREIKDRLRGLFLKRRFQVLEALAEAAARACLEDDRVQKVRVTAHKPGALTGADDVAVRITRKHA